MSYKLITLVGGYRTEKLFEKEFIKSVKKTNVAIDTLDILIQYLEEEGLNIFTNNIVEVTFKAIRQTEQGIVDFTTVLQEFKNMTDKELQKLHNHTKNKNKLVYLGFVNYMRYRKTHYLQRYATEMLTETKELLTLIETEKNKAYKQIELLNNKGEWI